ncbi:MAG: hypothetical protein M3Q20_03600 [Actinomycetota bacterium]|nr:hypothetical protein [Actinomycetota bacterium]
MFVDSTGADLFELRHPARLPRPEDFTTALRPFHELMRRGASAALELHVGVGVAWEA